MTDNEAPVRRKRARLSCVACNARRVKCNVTESRPCTNCVAGGTACETRESRRGKHPRKPRDSGSSGGQRNSVSQDPEVMYVLLLRWWKGDEAAMSPSTRLPNACSRQVRLTRTLQHSRRASNTTRLRRRGRSFTRACFSFIPIYRCCTSTTRHRRNYHKPSTTTSTDNSIANN